MECPRRPPGLMSALLATACCLGACHNAMHAGRQATDGAGIGDTGGDGSPGGTGTGGSRPDGGQGGAGGLARGGAGGSGLALGGSAGGGIGGARPGGQSGTVTESGGIGGSASGGIGGRPTGGAGGSPAGGIGGNPAGGGAGNVGGNLGGAPSGGGGGQGGGGPAGGAGGGGLTSLGGSGGFRIGGAGGSDPVGERPSDWAPPFVLPLGPPGWQQSLSPLCDQNGHYGNDSGFDAWADARGVFALIASTCSDGYYPCVVNDASVQLNAGSGWQPFYLFSADTTSYTTLLGGFQGGKLLVAGSFEKRFGVAFLDQDGLVFQMELGGYPLGGFVANKNVAGGDLAYAVGGTVLEYSAGTWSKVGEGDFIYSAWTDGKTAIAVGADQLILMGPVDGELEPLAGVPAGDYEAVWGFGGNDIWLGNSAGQLIHFDGSTWQAHQASSRASIQQLWGDAGMLYFSTAVEFGRWNGTSAELLLAPPAGTDVSGSKGRLGRFWGRSAKEVFIPVRDARYKGYSCGTAFMLFYDGAQFHWF